MPVGAVMDGVERETLPTGSSEGFRSNTCTVHHGASSAYHTNDIRLYLCNKKEDAGTSSSMASHQRF